MLGDGGCCGTEGGQEGGLGDGVAAEEGDLREEGGEMGEGDWTKKGGCGMGLRAGYEKMSEIGGEGEGGDGCGWG